jgi:hypothetical protein
MTTTTTLRGIIFMSVDNQPGFSHEILGEVDEDGRLELTVLDIDPMGVIVLEPDQASALLEAVQRPPRSL